jgi:tagatose-1,6-bisphosphate aldolase
MEKLFINGSDDTPEILLDKVKGIFRINGKSLPEDVLEFYSPVFSWFEQYVADPNEETHLEINVVYFNSASQRALNEIFSILSRLNVKGKKVDVEWFYNEDDDEMLEAGQEYADITNLPFHYKSYIPE